MPLIEQTIGAASANANIRNDLGSNRSDGSEAAQPMRADVEVVSVVPRLSWVKLGRAGPAVRCSICPDERHGKQPRDNEVGRLSIEHRAQFADLRSLTGGEAEFFQSSSRNFRMCRLPSTMQTRGDFSPARMRSAVPRCVSEDGSSVRIADVPRQKNNLRDSESKCVADHKKSVYSPRRSVEIRY